jgi:hybrid cluster-associated redox disulfide protein
LLRRKLGAEGQIARLFVAQQRGVRPGDYTGTMKELVPTSDMTVDQVMNRWPASIRVFMDFKMGCIGCPIATFHSVDDASREHNVDGAAFLTALRAVAG